MHIRLGDFWKWSLKVLQISCKWNPILSWDHLSFHWCYLLPSWRTRSRTSWNRRGISLSIVPSISMLYRRILHGHWRLQIFGFPPSLVLVERNTILCNWECKIRVHFFLIVIHDIFNFSNKLLLLAVLYYLKLLPRHLSSYFLILRGQYWQRDFFNLLILFWFIEWRQLIDFGYDLCLFAFLYLAFTFYWLIRYHVFFIAEF